MLILIYLEFDCLIFVLIFFSLVWWWNGENLSCWFRTIFIFSFFIFFKFCLKSCEGKIPTCNPTKLNLTLKFSFRELNLTLAHLITASVHKTPNYNQFKLGRRSERPLKHFHCSLQLCTPHKLYQTICIIFINADWDQFHQGCN